MRIVYLADTPDIGGAERHVATLSEEMAKAGHEVVLMAPQEELAGWIAREAPSVRVLQRLSDRYQRAPTQMRRGAALLDLLPDLVRSLRALAPDVVHANNGGFPGSDLCRLAMPAARIAGVKRRAMTVNSNPWPRGSYADPRVQVLADRVVLSCAHVIISPSQAVATGMQSRRGMHSDAGRLIHYGIPPANHDPTTVAQLKAELAPAGELLVGMVSARPVAAKGYDVFLDALAATRESVRGVLVGPVPEDLPGRVQSAGLQQRMLLAGRRSSVGNYYAAFDVLVVPSTAEECMPLVILEAASVGTPTFGSRLSGIPEAIGDGVEGRLFEPRAAAELAALIDAAARDRERTAAMGHAARAGWESRFRVETMLNATLAAYEVGAQPGTR